jgi:pyruvate dehydrogenase E2 component (dihydrolipoamide acetyltransferase)
MSKELQVPELGENITTATVVEVFVKKGDRVDRDQAVLSLETDKAQFELPAEEAGTIDEVLVGVGDDVTVGQAVVRLSGAGGTREAGERESGEQAPPKAAPDAGETEGAAQGDERPTTPVDAAEPTKGATTAAGEGGPVLPVRSGSDDADPGGRTEAKPVVPRPAEAPIAAAPSVRRLARELGIRVEDVAAETDDGRVTAAAVRAFTKRGARAVAAPSPSAVPPGLLTPEPLPDFSRWGEIEIEEMSKIRRKTAQNMARAWAEIPTVTHHDEADVTQLEALRKRYAARVEKAGGQLTWTAILLHVLAGALRRFPQFNASVDMANGRIVYKKYVHIGVAVDTERGLLVPVIRDVDQKNIVQLASALTEVSQAARGGNIKPDTMQGATFTISNLGGIGGVSFNPIINPPQVAILGVSRGSIRPRWVEDKFVPRQILPLSLSYDHRVIDGADAAHFLRWTCEALEEPFLLDLEGQ